MDINVLQNARSAKKYVSYKYGICFIFLALFLPFIGRVVHKQVFKINRIYESYKKGYAFKCLYALFWPVCPALIGRVARYTPSSELNIQTKIEHRII